MATNRYNAAQAAVVDRDARNMATQQAGVVPLSAELNAVWAAIDTGTIGITSAAGDVDSLALGGGAFSVDPVLTTGLTFAVQAGRVYNGMSVVAVAPAALTLAASATNYVEVDRAGVVYANTAGWTAGRLPLYLVVTGVGAITTTTSAKPLLTLLGPGSVTGAMLSVIAGQKHLHAQLGAINATATYLFVVPAAGTLRGVSFVTATAVATSDANNWAWSLVDKGQAGAGAAALLAGGAGVNTTQATGGTAMAAYVARALTPTTLTTGGELNVAAGDVLALTVTATGAPTAMAGCAVRLDFGFTG